MALLQRKINNSVFKSIGVARLNQRAAPIYQILISLSLSRYILSPGFTLKAE